MRYKPTKEQLENLILTQKLNYNQIHEICGYCPSVISELKKQYEIPNPPKRYLIAKEQLQKWIYEDKLSYQEISFLSGVSKTYIGKLIINIYKIKEKRKIAVEILPEKTFLYELNTNKLSWAQIAVKYNLNSSTISILAKKYKIKSKKFHSKKWKHINNEKHKECQKCLKFYPLNYFHLAGHGKQLGAKCTNCATKHNTIKRYRIKETIIECFGGGCFICNYNKCIKALIFHHLNPKTKEYAPARMIQNKFSFEKIVKELRKCIMVCSNCHAEIHDKKINLPSLLEARKDEYESYLRNLDNLLPKIKPLQQAEIPIQIPILTPFPQQERVA